MKEVTERHPSADGRLGSFSHVGRGTPKPEEMAPLPSPPLRAAPVGKTAQSFSTMRRAGSPGVVAAVPPCKMAEQAGPRLHEAGRREWAVRRAARTVGAGR